MGNYSAAAAKSLQPCSTLCDPIDGSPLGSPVPGILKAITLEWVAISFSNAWKWKVKVKWLSRLRLLATPWTVAHQAPPSMGFSRQEYWSGVPLPSPNYSAPISKDNLFKYPCLSPVSGTFTHLMKGNVCLEWAPLTQRFMGIYYDYDSCFGCGSNWHYDLPNDSVHTIVSVSGRWNRW